MSAVGYLRAHQDMNDRRPTWKKCRPPAAPSAISSMLLVAMVLRVNATPIALAPANGGLWVIIYVRFKNT